MVVLLAVALPNLRLARELTVFNVRAREYRYVAAGRFVADQLPADRRDRGRAAQRLGAVLQRPSGDPARPSRTRVLRCARRLGGSRAAPSRVRARRIRTGQRCGTASATRRSPPSIGRPGPRSGAPSPRGSGSAPIVTPIAPAAGFARRGSRTSHGRSTDGQPRSLGHDLTAVVRTHRPRRHAVHRARAFCASCST